MQTDPSLHAETPDPRPRWPRWRWLPALVSAGVLLLTAGLFLLQGAEQRRHVARLASAEARHVATRLERDVRERVASLNRLADRWIERGGTPRAEWEADALQFVRDAPGYQAIEWVDTEYRVRWVVPLTGNEAALDFDLAFEETRRSALEAARRRGEAMLTEPIDLVQGGKGFLVYVPIGRGDDFAGFVLAVFRVEAWLDRVLADTPAGEYAVAVLHRDEELCARNGERAANSGLPQESVAQLLDVPWRITAEPTAALLARNHSRLPWLVLGSGGLLALLAGVIARLAQTGVAREWQIRDQIARRRETERVVGVRDAELAESHEALSENERILGSILDSIADGVAVADRHGQFLLFNPAGERIIGIGAVDIAPEQWSQEYGLFLPDRVTPFPHDELPLMRAIRGETVHDCELFVRNRELPQGVLLSVNATPLLDERGEIRGGVAVFRDVTDRRAAAEKLRREEQLLRKLLAIHEKERQLIAYEIHDGFVQDVVGAKLRLDGLEGVLAADGADTDPRLQETLHLLGRAITEGRRMIGALRPLILDERGLVEAVYYLVCEAEQRGPAQIAFHHDVEFERLDPLLEGTIFRIAQEALNNVSRHSGARDATVLMTQQNGRVRLEIEDRGDGFDPEDVPADRFGVRGMQERARLFGGQATIESAPGEGTRVVVELPTEPLPD